MGWFCYLFCFGSGDGGVGVGIGVGVGLGLLFVEGAMGVLFGLSQLINHLYIITNIRILV